MDGFYFPPAQRLPTPAVYEPEPRLVETGLLDQYGRKIVREERREPIGFVRFKTPE